MEASRAMFVPSVIVLVTVLSFIGGGWLFKPLWKSDSSDQTLAVTSFFALWAALVTWTLSILSGPLFYWNDWRMVGPAGLARGLKVYFPFGTGPAIHGLNGPTFALTYLPAGLFTTPHTVIIAGCLTIWLIFFLPVLWIQADEKPRSGKNLAYAISGFIIFCLFALKFSSLASLASLASIIHADAPAIGLCLLGCGLLLSGRGEIKHRQLALCALCCALAFWAKITVAGVFVGIFFFLVFRKNVKAALTFFGWSVLALGLVTAVYCACFGSHELFDNAWTGSVSAPWQAHVNPMGQASFAQSLNQRLYALLSAAQEFMQLHCTLIFGLFFLALFARFYRQQTSTSLLARLDKDMVYLFSWIAIAMLPMALMARVKAGGASNTYSTSVYFLLAALALVPGRILASSRDAMVQGIAKCLLIAALGIGTLLSVQSPHSSFSLSRELNNSLVQKAFIYAKQYPHQAYLPHEPLVNLRIDGVIYHGASSLTDLDFLGMPMTDAQFRAAIP